MSDLAQSIGVIAYLGVGFGLVGWADSLHERALVKTIDGGAILLGILFWPIILVGAGVWYAIARFGFGDDQ